MSKIVTVGSNNIITKLFSNQLIILILLIPYFKTIYFDYIGLSFICNTLLALECFFFSFINLLENRFTIFSKIIIILEIWTFFIAPLISKAERPSFFYLAGTFGILFLFELGMSRNAAKLINTTSNLFTMMMILNTLTHTILKKNFILDESIIYLFGLRTGFSLFIIPGIMFNLLKDKYENRKGISLQTIITFLIGIFSLFEQKVATGICELFIIVILFIILKKERNEKKINFLWMAIAILLLNISMTLYGIQNNIIKIVSDIFNKDITLSGRTEIWAKCVEKLSHSPIAGVGKDAVVNIGLTQRPAHNQWLHVAMEGGYMAMFILIIAIIFSFSYLNRKCQRSWYKIVGICMISILVGSITEIQTYVPFLFVIYDLPYLLERESIKRNEMMKIE